MVCFASWRNLGQIEDTSCYLIFLQEANGAGKEVAYCLPIIPPELQKVTSSRCHSIKATSITVLSCTLSPSS